MDKKEKWLDCALPPAERAQALMSELTIEEKLAQLTGVFALPGYEERMEQLLSNGVGQISTLEFRNQKAHTDAAAWQRKLQELVMRSSRLHVPAVFHMEGLCGPLMEGGVSFPSGIGRGASFHPETEEEIAKIVSRQELSCGITQILAPVLDIARDPRMGRYSEPYSEDPTLAAVMGAHFTKGIQSTQVDGRHAESVAKHFLAFHTSQGGIHGANTEMGETFLRERCAKPFEASVREGLRGVMPCYCSMNGLPLHASKKYLTDLLRDEIGFDGVVVSDYSGVENAHKVQHVGETLADAGYRCMKAGNDVELPMPSAYSKELAEKFRSGGADMAVLDRAVLRVLTAKFRMGVFEHPFALDGAELQSTYKNENDREVTLRSARESIVLLKNESVLPLAKDVKKIALIGPHGKNARFFFGGYTEVSMVEGARAAANSMAGVGEVDGTGTESGYLTVPGTHIQSDDTPEFADVLNWLHPGCHSLYEELTERLPDTEIRWARGYQIFGEDEGEFAPALELARDADLIILTLGGKNGTGSIATMGEGVDGTDINLPPCQDAFISEVKKLDKPMIGVHLDGRPISSDVADEDLDAILECWSPAECGAQAIVDVLTGTVNPSGKLPCTVARSAGQIPVWYDHMNGSQWHQGQSIGFQNYVDMSHTPRYEFGFGLSYTSFGYDNLSLSTKEVDPDGTLTVTAKITNTGERAGTEIVQLYLRDRYASMVRPVMELAGFARVELRPGEEKEVAFTVSASQMAFLDEDLHWVIEKGDIDVMVGSSSKEPELKGSFHITATKRIDGKTRKLFATAAVQ